MNFGEKFLEHKISTVSVKFKIRTFAIDQMIVLSIELI